MAQAITAAAPGGVPASVTPAVDARAGGGAAGSPLDVTAETVPDAVTTISQQLARQAQLVLMRQQSEQTVLQLRLDRMRANFNAAQEMRAERMREMNALRDMAVEQGKKDDEILKKYIAMI